MSTRTDPWPAGTPCWVDLSVPEVKYRTFEQKLSFFRRVQEALAPLPVILHVSYADGIPLAPPSQAHR